MTSKTTAIRSSRTPHAAIDWDAASPLTMEIETRAGDIKTRHGRFVGGLADGVEAIEVDTGVARTILLPTRGLSLWELESDGVRFGWNSPVPGPVHPAHVPLYDPSGLGWLEGFDEWVVRCGLQSNGAPAHNQQHQLTHPLHGRIANTPSNSLGIEYDEASGRLEVSGEMIESRLFFNRLRLQSRVRFQAGSADIKLLDDVTNDLAKPDTMQLLYHINVGSPVLEEAAQLEAPIAKLAPKDELSASEIEQWNQYGPPQEGYAERVYFAELRSDDANSTSAMLRTNDGTRGLAITFNTKTLPYFIVWKNTAATEDGYVTGLEPATNFPNPHPFEAQQGRVVKLGPGETVSFRVTLHPLTTTEAVDAMSARIKRLQADQPGEIHSTPQQGWSP